MKILYAPIVLTLVAMSAPAEAQTDRAEAAIQCAAIYYIPTAIAPPKSQMAASFQGLQEIFQSIFQASEEARKRATLTNGDISKAKSKALDLLSTKYDRDPMSVYSVEMRCNLWREKIAPQMLKSATENPNSKMSVRFLNSLPDIPSTPSFNDPRWDQSKMLLDASFAAWTEKGRLTPQKLKDQLRRSLDK
jgi:hypothetical protein